MEWIIWVIVIVLIIAIVWWRLNRNSGNTAAAQDSARTDQVTSAASTGTQGDVTASERPQAGGTAASAAAASAAAATTGMAVGAGRTTEPDAGPAAAEAPARQGSPVAAQAEPEDLEPDIESWDAATPRPSAEEPATGASGTATTGEAPAAAAADAWESPSSAPGRSPAGGDVDDWDDDEDKAEWDAQWSDAGGAPAAAAQGTGATPAAAAQPATPVHHAEYTEPHAPTLPGAESAAAEAFDAEAETKQRIASSPATEAAASHEAEPSGHAAEGTGGASGLDQEPIPGTEPALGGEPGQPYGEGSAAAAADGSAPDGYVVKGDIGSMTYYDEDSSGYEEARAEVWFLTAAHAEAAGFRAPRRSRR